MQRRRELFTEMGVEFQLNTEDRKKRSRSSSELQQNYDAVFVGAGTYQPMGGGLENEDAAGCTAPAVSDRQYPSGNGVAG